VPNSDGAGIVDQTGRGVSERWLGKRVWLYNGQCFVELFLRNRDAL
jgi:NADPH:quinone reductase-like Zn-dependent oxidoreductase